MNEDVVFPATPQADPNTPVDQSLAQPLVDSQPVAAPAVDTTQPSAPPQMPAQSGLMKKIGIGVGIFFVFIILLFLVFSHKSAPKNVTLVWWGLWEDSNIVQPVIDDFHKQHPNITITYIKQDPNGYRERLLTRMQNGTGPDIFRFHNSWMPMLSGSLLPLSANVITPDAFKKAYPPVVQSDLTNNGAIYGIPLDMDTLVMFANSDLFDKAGLQVPSTWTDFDTASKKLTVKDPTTKQIKTAGAALGTYDNIAHASDIISMLFVQQGVNMSKFTDASNTSKVQDALTFYTAFAKGDDKVWDATLDNSTLAFARGNLALYFGYSWDIFAIQQLNSNLKFKTYPVPGLQGGNNPTIASYWVEGASSKGQHSQEALLFLKYLAQKDVLEKLYTEEAKERTFGELYPRTDMTSLLDSNALLAPFESQLPNAYATAFASNTYDGDTGLNSALNAYLGNAVTSIVNGDGADTAVSTLDKGVVQVLQKYAIQ